jgi:predicted RNase H-like nuclease (RuvC/YqgF family)
MKWQAIKKLHEAMTPEQRDEERLAELRYTHEVEGEKIRYYDRHVRLFELGLYGGDRIEELEAEVKKLEAWVWVLEAREDKQIREYERLSIYNDSLRDLVARLQNRCSYFEELAQSLRNRVLELEDLLGGWSPPDEG